MAFQERNFSFGACEREFEKIQHALQGISEDIDQKLTDSSSPGASSFSKENEASTSSDDLNDLLTCEESNFEAEISKMKTVDLDMAVIIFEEQIKMGQKLGEGKHSGKKELNQLRERLTRCFMRRAELVRGGGKPFEGEKYTSKTNRSISLTDADRSTDVDSVDDVSSLSISELKSLLVHNGIEFDENASKDVLETIVKCEILQIEDGELDDWEPPGDNDIQWKSPATKSETEENFAFATTVNEDENPDKQHTAETTSEGSEQTLNETKVADTDSFPEPPNLGPITDDITCTEELPVSTDTASASVTADPESNARPQEQLSSDAPQEQSSSDTEKKEESLELKTVQEPEAQASPNPALVEVKTVQEPEAQASPNLAPVEESKAQTSPNPAPVQEPAVQGNPNPAPVQEPAVQANPNPVPVQEPKAQISSTPAPAETQNNAMSEEKENIHKKKIEEGTVVDWDPIPLLRDLYKPLERVEAIDFAKNEEEKKSPQKPNQQCKLDGYLEKLPVNQTKSTLLKGWKKRYFKIATGKLFYFENHLSTVHLGSILLTGSELKVPGEKTILIKSQNTGDTITLRCSSSNESNDWYRALKRESAISTPVTAPVKVPLQLENPKSSTIIIDLGASTIKGGFTGEDKPRVVFPAVYAVKTGRKDGRKFTDAGIPDPSLCTCGYDAFRPEIRQKSKLVFPLRATLKVDKYSIKTRYIPGFIDKVLKDLRVDPTQSTIILSCQRNIGERDKEILFDHLFGHLGVKAVYAQQQALLALYSYKDTTGVVVDIGDHIDVMPVIEGVIIENGSSCLPQGGQLITEHLSRLLSEGGYRFFSEVESYIVRYMKEKTAFVSLDYENEIEIFHKALDVDVQKYNLPGKQTSIATSSERFRCAEGLFDPNKWGKDYEGIHKLVEKAVKQSGIDYRKEICRKVFLSGGSTLIEGLPERLQKELKYLMPETVHIQVHAAENRENAAFMGATVISEQPTFSQLLVTKEAWHDHGADIFKRMTQS